MLRRAKHSKIEVVAPEEEEVLPFCQLILEPNLEISLNFPSL